MSEQWDGIYENYKRNLRVRTVKVEEVVTEIVAENEDFVKVHLFTISLLP